MSSSFRSSCRYSLVAAFSILAILFSGCSLSRQTSSSSEIPNPGSTGGISSSDVPPGSPRAVKIFTSQEGIYEVSRADLEKAGLETQEKSLQTLVLFNRGQQVPLWFGGDASGEVPTPGSVYFYALPSLSRFASENVYWLVQGASPGADGPWSVRPTQDETLSPREPLTTTEILAPGAYLATTLLEQNQLYTPQVEQGDPWLWLSMAAPNAQSVDLSLKDLALGSGVIRVALWARTEASANPDHHLILSVNGQPVADRSWDGKGRYQLDASIPTGLLKEGVNNIGLQLVSIDGVPANIVLLDWIEVGYPHKFTPQDDRLDFTGSGDNYSLTGFSGKAGIFDVSDGKHPTLVSVQGGKDGAFEGLKGHRYLVVGPKGYLHPDHLSVVVSSPDLRAAGLGADYVAIGPSDLLQPLQPLLDFHQQNGLKVISVPVDAVYDQFGSGFPEPQAIRDFMKYAARDWNPAPHYLLLVGDATYDPRGYQSSAELNRLPAFLISTVYGGETASDVDFSQLDDDSKPDLAVGRIPAARPEQVSVLVKKILDFESSAQQRSGSPHLLAVADGQDPNFQVDAQKFLDLFPSNFQTELLAPPAGASGTDQQIIDRLKQGDLLVAYFGHGSLNMWGKDHLFTTQDVAELTGMQQLPVFFNLTCLTGLFTHPQIESLAETLLWQAGGGAAAVLAPTSLTLPTDQSFLYKPLVQAMLDDPSGSLGDFLLSARRQVPMDAPGRRDVMETFLLFGDPAMQLLSAGN
jgi:hypothetical protein